VTQQYILGELSCLLDALEPMPGVFRGAVSSLRHEVETCSLSMLGPLLSESFSLTDRACWAALEQGDIAAFCRCGEAGTALLEFATIANLLP
jgi:hypothetical protein